MDKKPILFVTENDAGQRLDNYLLKQKKQLDKSTCYKLIRKGQIRVNGKRSKPLYKLMVGDQVRMPPFVFFVESKKIDVSMQEQKQLLRQVFFEDDAYLVINKPAGLPCHKGTAHDHGVAEIMASIDGYEHIQLAHRLDKETSGCLLLAKNRSALLFFQEELIKQQVTKSYLAVLTGQVEDQVLVNQALDTKHRLNGIRHVVVSESGQPAQTVFKPIKSNSKYTLTQCDIQSGRTHQIRVHAQFLGHAVLGDRFYGSKQPKLDRQLYLHSKLLAFGDYSFSLPVPAEFSQMLK